MHRWDYNTNTTQKKEFENIYKTFWHFGIHKSEIQKNKDYVILKLYDFEVVFYNDNGNIIAFYNMCPHRGAKLMFSDENNSIYYGNSEIKCQYHHWIYKNSKLSIPSKIEFKNAEKLDLFKINTDFCGDFIFFSHNPSTTLNEQLGDYYDELKNISQSIQCFIGLNSPIDYNCNWKIGIENSLEAYHINYVHPCSLGILSIKDTPSYSNTNSKTNANIYNSKIYTKLEKVRSIFNENNYSDNKYFSYHLFPFTILSSTFGYAYSIQNYFPNTPDKTHFISRNYISKSKLNVEAFSKEVINMNKTIFKEDAQVCNLIHGSVFLNDELKYHYAKESEKRITYFHSQYNKYMETE